ncbi:MAG: histidine kinase dimerization/phospho-acceptor domain-containing protein [Rhodoferax sp.]
MSTQPMAQHWPDSRFQENAGAADTSGQALARLWQAFMTARLVLAVVLVVLQTALLATGISHSQLQLFVSAGYLALTLVSRSVIAPRPLGQSFNRAWTALVGLDILTFTTLQALQGGVGSSTINYTPLFALPVLLASVLGSLRLALGTAAGVTVLMLSGAMLAGAHATSSLVQLALSGAGFFAVAWLSNQLSTRLADEGLRARKNQLAAAIQQQVNEQIIESLSDGVLVVDERGLVRAANPAARALLGSDRALCDAVFDLQDEASWQPLLQAAQRSIRTRASLAEEVTLVHAQHGHRRLHVKSRLASSFGESLCVLFLQDQREIEARLRTEKMASMGRLSTAVAHEIRNPLSAIAQANALLDEDVSDPRLKRLTGMVDQNAKRLEKIVNDILNVARIQPALGDTLVPNMPLALTTRRICSEWAQQNGAQQRLSLQLLADHLMVRFDSGHLHQVLINLLDNALRYTPDQEDAIQVLCEQSPDNTVRAVVWSLAAPLEPSVQAHLFEPFFSSDSRSSGLGLYICRELCERHGASLHYERMPRTVGDVRQEGNAFVVTFAVPQPLETLDEESATPWQPKLY